MCGTVKMEAYFESCKVRNVEHWHFARLNHIATLDGVETHRERSIALVEVLVTHLGCHDTTLLSLSEFPHQRRGIEAQALKEAHLRLCETMHNAQRVADAQCTDLLGCESSKILQKEKRKK
jgi:hypothetical protein